MALKIVVFYNQGAQGWTETYYSNTTVDPYTYLGTTLPDALLKRLVNFRHALTELVAVRVSDTITPRLSYTRSFIGAYTGGFQKPTTDTPDVTSTDAVVKLVTSVGASRKIFVRGISDKDVERKPNGIVNPSSYLLNGVREMVNALVSNQWCIRIQIRPPAAGYNWIPVDSVNTVGRFAVIKTPIDPQIVITNGGRVTFQGVPKDDLPGFPNQADVIGVSHVAPFSITIAYRVRNSEAIYIPAKMRFVQLGYRYVPIFAGNFNSFSEHKTGRAFGVPRGRASVTIRRQ